MSRVDLTIGAFILSVLVGYAVIAAWVMSGYVVR